MRKTPHGPVQLNRGIRLKDVALKSSNSSRVKPTKHRQSTKEEEPLVAMSERLLSHLTASQEEVAASNLGASDERKLSRAVALLGDGNKYNQIVSVAIKKLDNLCSEVIDTTHDMVKDIHDAIVNKHATWIELGIKSKSEAARNLALCLKTIQDYGRGVIGAPDHSEEHTFRFTSGDGKNTHDVLAEMESILTGRTLIYQPANSEQQI